MRVRLHRCRFNRTEHLSRHANPIILEYTPSIVMPQTAVHPSDGAREVDSLGGHACAATSAKPLPKFSSTQSLQKPALWSALLSTRLGSHMNHGASTEPSVDGLCFVPTARLHTGKISYSSSLHAWADPVMSSPSSGSGKVSVAPPRASEKLPCPSCCHCRL